MLREEQATLPVVVGGEPPKLRLEQRLLEQLLFEPHRDGHRERAEASWRERHIGLQQTLELQEWLVVEDDVVDPIERHPRLAQAVVDGVSGKARVVLLAREPLFLSGGHDATVLNEGGGT